VNQNYATLGRSDTIAQVLSGQRGVKAYGVTDLSLASLTFRKAWVFYWIHILLNTGPSAVQNCTVTLLKVLKQSRKHLVSNLDSLFSSSKMSPAGMFTNDSWSQAGLVSSWA